MRAIIRGVCGGKPGMESQCEHFGGCSACGQGDQSETNECMSDNGETGSCEMTDNMITGYAL